ncbi:TonB-dependent receptor [Pseudoalteromonas sp. MMG022]|uniref:TonB-dependent receptor plug domain-containing protein n=1 Tax=Pseudoalteromonas sp. MMG022 TaxID=2909978 RepID=UPI0031BA7206|nr:TonB-dependent receptor plug domain-containing protein [Pseudoalteromonas sp. MMG022]
MSKRLAVCCIWVSSIFGGLLQAQEDEQEIFSLTLNDLLELSVTSGSERAEKLRYTPASIQVLTKEQIKQRGYTSLSEAITDFSGFDLSTSYGSEHTTFYQRGYRTPSAQRTLVMINGIINNRLWSHDFPANRQIPLTGIERVEVLSGPAGAVYGPNAFLGVINIITQKGKDLESDEHHLTMQVQMADFDSKGLDFTVLGKQQGLSYWLSAKVYESDGPELEDMATWDFTNEQYLSDERFWGPVLNYKYNGVPYGEYVSKNQEQGVFGEISYDGLTAGVNHWITHTGYGVQFSFDRGQPNATWSKRTNMYYLEYDHVFSSGFGVKSFLRYRTEQRYGNWAEASPDKNSENSQYSFVTISDWNSFNSSWQARQDYDYQYSDSLHLAAGIKYERKELTKAYEICGYWASAYCSLEDDGQLGPYGLGKGVYYSTDSSMPVLLGALGEMDESNLIRTTDRGAYFRASLKMPGWSLSGAIRWDNNSTYGTFIKPRVAATYDYNERNTFKIIYATAFQEPAPIQLYGGWNGRNANPNLLPEEVRDLSLIWMYQSGAWFSDWSAFYSKYKNVIKEEADNAGKRDVKGIEWRVKYEMDNHWFDAAQISSYINYSYTDVTSYINYDHQRGRWIGSGSAACKQDSTLCEEYRLPLGDIAPHKLNIGFNVPVTSQWSVNTRFNYVSSRHLYLRNPLRAQGIKLGDYLTTNLNLTWRSDRLSVHVKINNLFDSQIYHSGLGPADSGNAFTSADGNLSRTQGFYNSVLPQVGRNWEVVVTASF